MFHIYKMMGLHSLMWSITIQKKNVQIINACFLKTEGQCYTKSWRKADILGITEYQQPCDFEWKRSWSTCLRLGDLWMKRGRIYHPQMHHFCMDYFDWKATQKHIKKGMLCSRKQTLFLEMEENSHLKDDFPVEGEKILVTPGKGGWKWENVSNDLAKIWQYFLCFTFHMHLGYFSTLAILPIYKWFVYCQFLGALCSYTATMYLQKLLCFLLMSIKFIAR